MAANERFGFTVKATDQSQRGLSAVLNNTKRWSSRMKSAVTSPFRAMASMQTFAFAQNARMLGRVVSGFIDLNEVQQQAEAKLQGVLRATNSAAGRTLQQLKDQASAIQNVSNFGDEAILNAQGILATFKNIKGDVFDETTKALVDMSAVMGSDLQQGAVQLGKALNEPLQGLTALTRVGVTFSEIQKATVRRFVEQGRVVDAQRLILKELQSQFEGTAKTMVRPLQQMKNALGDLGEQLGQVLEPFIARVANKIKEMANNLGSFLSENMRILQDMANTSLGGAAEGLVAGAGAAVRPIISGIKGAIGAGSNNELIQQITGMVASLPLEFTKIFLKIEQAAMRIVDKIMENIGETLVTLAVPVSQLFDKFHMFDAGEKALKGMVKQGMNLKATAQDFWHQANRLDGEIESIDGKIDDVWKMAKQIGKDNPGQKMADTIQEAGNRVGVLWNQLRGGTDRVLGPILRKVREISDAGKLTGDNLKNAFAEAGNKVKEATQKLVEAQRALRGFRADRSQREFEVALARARTPQQRAHLQFQRAEQLFTQSRGASSEDERIQKLQQSRSMVLGLQRDQGIFQDARARELVDAAARKIEQELIGIGEGRVTQAKAGVQSAESRQAELEKRVNKEAWDRTLQPARESLGAFKQQVDLLTSGFSKLVDETRKAAAQPDREKGILTIGFDIANKAIMSTMGR